MKIGVPLASSHILKNDMLLKIRKAYAKFTFVISLPNSSPVQEEYQLVLPCPPAFMIHMSPSCR
jgi:hypothetical protein